MLLGYGVDLLKGQPACFIVRVDCANSLMNLLVYERVCDVLTYDVIVFLVFES